MGLMRRLLGLATPAERGHVIGAGQVQIAMAPVRPAPVPAPAAVTALACPWCAALLDPPPVRDRLCPRCRQPVVVRHLDGRVVLLTREAVTTFEAERRRAVEERVWAAARQRWLRLARRINASPVRRARLEAAPASADVVALSRRLYVTAAERSVKAARHDRRWGDVGRIRREQARALFDELGRPVPPPEEIAQLYREGMTAVLRSILPLARGVELVSSGCCPACRTEDGRTFRVTTEVREARLPHPGCPAGLCGCDWWPATTGAKRPGRRRGISRAAQQ